MLVIDAYALGMAWLSTLLLWWASSGSSWWLAELAVPVSY